ncbi:hypothetical protein D3C72_2560150 [compost metagenome]
MQLDGVLPDKAAGLADRDLGGGNGARALGRRRFEIQRGQQDGRIRRLNLHEHIDHTVLQHLQL